MQIYNANHIDSNTKFILAVLAGIGSAVILGIVYGIFKSRIPVEMEILYLGIGYGIGYVIRTVGRGVTNKFAITGAICALLSVIISDIVRITGVVNLGYVFLHPQLFGSLLFSLTGSLLSNVWGWLGLMFRAAGIYTAYCESRIF